MNPNPILYPFTHSFPLFFLPVFRCFQDFTVRMRGASERERESAWEGWKGKVVHICLSQLPAVGDDPKERKEIDKQQWRKRLRRQEIGGLAALATLISFVRLSIPLSLISILHQNELEETMWEGEIENGEETGNDGWREDMRFVSLGISHPSSVSHSFLPTLLHSLSGVC